MSKINIVCPECSMSFEAESSEIISCPRCETKLINRLGKIEVLADKKEKKSSVGVVIAISAGLIAVTIALGFVFLGSGGASNTSEYSTTTFNPPIEPDMQTAFAEPTQEPQVTAPLTLQPISTPTPAPLPYERTPEYIKNLKIELGELRSLKRSLDREQNRLRSLRSSAQRARIHQDRIRFYDARMETLRDEISLNQHKIRSITQEIEYLEN